MFDRFVLATVFEANQSVFSKGEQIGEEKSVGGFDLVFVVFGLFFVARADRMASRWKGHVASAPVIAAAAPFFSASSVSLRGLAVIEKESGIAFERVEICAVGENKRCADEIARPVAATFGASRVEKHQIVT